VKKGYLKEGISLIVLVITIIVIIILAGSVILSLSKNNPITSATEAKFKTNIESYNSELTLAVATQYALNPSFDSKSINATTWNGNISNINGTVKQYISTMTVEDGEKYGIVGGKLVFVGLIPNEKQWVTDTGILSGTLNFGYTGTTDIYIVPITGSYKIELWGAQGGSPNTINRGGYGGYTVGNIYLTIGTVLYFNVGDCGYQPANLLKPFNGGGAPDITGDWVASYTGNYSGGGATDVRLVSGLWDNSDSLKSRIMVAGGGAGGNSGDGSIGGAGGGILGGNTATPISNIIIYGATQTTGNAFGIGQSSGYADTGAGGGGYYGGYRGYDSNCGGSGGSSYISGFAGCNAINISGVHTGQSNHYSGNIFTNMDMIDGNGYKWTNVIGAQTQMPNPNSGYYSLGVGNIGDGYAKITFLNK
jgi:uncharacterized protein (UPF0333 family)